jgi:hypothetical protein
VKPLLHGLTQGFTSIVQHLPRCISGDKRMKFKVKVTLVLNGKESAINQTLMHKIRDAEKNHIVPEITEEEHKFMTMYDEEVAKIDNGMAVMDGEATAVYGKNHRS